MSFPDLRAFLDQLRRDGDLVTVDAEVDANQEAAEIHRRVIAAGGPALLFTNVRGKAFPLVTNLFGTPRRAELAFGTRPLRLIKRIVELAETLMPPTPAKLWGARDVGREALRIGLRRGVRGPVLDVVEPPALDRLPALTCWPEDGGPFVTLPLVYTEHPDGKGHNLGMYRLQVHDGQTTGMHWQIGKGGGFHYQLAESRGKALPVSVFLGGPPALILSAIAPLPENVPELMLASLIAGERLPLSTAPGGHAHPLVANAEFALMGEVAPASGGPKGPFGDHYGYYSLRHDYPVFRVRQVAPAQRRHLSGHRRRQAAAGGLLHRRLAAGAAVAAVPAGDAGRSRSVVVRRDRLPLAGRRDRPRSVRARGHGQRVPDPGRRAAVAHEVPDRDRPARGLEGLPRDARTPARAHAS